MRYKINSMYPELALIAGGSECTNTSVGERRLTGSTPGASTNVDRQTGFVQRALERGLPEPQVIKAGKFSYEAGYLSGKKVAGLPKRPDGVFCANDIVAIGFIEGVQESLGLKVPDDMSVVGYDDIAMAAWPSHQLTTVAQPIDEMMAATVELTAELARNSNISPRVANIPPGPLIERRSTQARKEQPR